MATYDFASQTPRITTRPAVATRVIAAAANLYRTWKNRRDFYRLGDMSDAELADIGLTRADLHAAGCLPFGSDPTAKLGSIARDRCRAAENAARKRA